SVETGRGTGKPRGVQPPWISSEPGPATLRRPRGCSHVAAAERVHTVDRKAAVGAAPPASGRLQRVLQPSGVPGGQAVAERTAAAQRGDSDTARAYRPVILC